jgi:hypothetical protein
MKRERPQENFGRLNTGPIIQKYFALRIVAILANGERPTQNALANTAVYTVRVIIKQ